MAPVPLRLGRSAPRERAGGAPAPYAAGDFRSPRRRGKDKPTRGRRASGPGAGDARNPTGLWARIGRARLAPWVSRAASLRRSGRRRPLGRPVWGDEDARLPICDEREGTSEMVQMGQFTRSARRPALRPDHVELMTRPVLRRGLTADATRSTRKPPLAESPLPSAGACGLRQPGVRSSGEEWGLARPQLARTEERLRPLPKARFGPTCRRLPDAGFSCPWAI